MTKFTSVVLFLMICSFATYAGDPIDDIANKACECLDEVSDELDKEEATIRLGLCMIEAAEPHKKYLKKKHGIDIENINSKSEGRKLGQLVGIKMASICGTKLVKLMSDDDDEKEEEETMKEDTPKKSALMSVEGKVTAVELNGFVVFTVKEESGGTSKYYWLGMVETEADLMTQYQEMKDKTLMLSYRTQKMFDPRINEYREYNVITALKVK